MVASPKKAERKVRAPQGAMLANGEGERSHGKCHRKENAFTLPMGRVGKAETVV